MADLFKYMTGERLKAPYTKAVAVTPSDTVEISVSRGLYIGTGGQINAILADDTDAVVFMVSDRQVLDLMRFKRILATNTTATNLVALY